MVRSKSTLNPGLLARSTTGQYAVLNGMLGRNRGVPIPPGRPRELKDKYMIYIFLESKNSFRQKCCRIPTDNSLTFCGNGKATGSACVV